MTKPLSVVFAGGGTAGHVNPLLSMASELKKLDPSVKVCVIGTSAGLESMLVPEAGFELETIQKVPFPRRPDSAALKFPVRWLSEKRRVREILTRHGADIVVGVGGYAAAPAYSAAHYLKLPLIIHEQNARAGMANKLGSRWADFVGTVYDNTGLRGGRGTIIQRVGLPLRESVSRAAGRLERDRVGTRLEAKQQLGLDVHKPVILITGGSLGAVSLNTAVSDSAESLLACAQVIHLTGKGKLAAVAHNVSIHAGRQHLAGLSFSSTGPGSDGGGTASSGDYHAAEYWERMDIAFCAADLVICRSGAGTVAELSALGVPAVYVPLPVGNGEQRLNAQPVADAGGGYIVNDADLDPEWIKSHIPGLITDRDRLAGMSRASWGYGVRNAATVMAQHILEVSRC